MKKDTYSIWLQGSNHNKTISNLIRRFAEEEKKTFFTPHVTLVSNISLESKGFEILRKISKDKTIVEFDKVSTGSTYFQRLYLEPSDSSTLSKYISNLDGWPSLWIPHLSLCYGDKLPKSFDLGELNELIPITLSFDTLSLYKTGPKVSEWKELTTLRLN